MLYLSIIGFKAKKSLKFLTFMNSSWNKKKIKLKQKFGVIKDKDLAYKIGSEWDMVKKLRIKLKKSTKELLSIFIEF